MTVQLRANAEDLIQFSARPVAPAAETAIKGGVGVAALVLTDTGLTAAADLKVGDRVMTQERGFVRLHRAERILAAACTIRTDCLGLARPARDITVASDQHLTLRDWRAAALFDAAEALVPAARLTDGVLIADAGTTELVRLDMAAPLTILADGLEIPTGRTENGVIDLAEID